MSSRTPVRGVGSNQHADRPPAAPSDPTPTADAAALGRFLDDPFDDPGDPWDTEGFPGNEAAAWRDAGFDDPVRAAGFRDAGLTPDRAADWVDAGLDVGDLADWDGRQTPDEIVATPSHRPSSRIG